jgi:DNA modification methylase
MAASGIQVQSCITSPPYYGLRDYGNNLQIGLEETPEEFIDNLIEVFSCVRNVLKDDGTLWVNIGDSYAGSGKGPAGNLGCKNDERNMTHTKSSANVPINCKPKDLIGVPWMLAFALRNNGWYLRQDIIWHKPNPMPESVQDRCTKAHEYIFLLSKNKNYYFDNQAIKEPAIHSNRSAGNKNPQKGATKEGMEIRSGLLEAQQKKYEMSNKRDVWTVPVKAYTGAHFAVYPEELVEPCVLASTKVGDVILDPFFGSGTTGQVAQNLGRKWIGCELNKDYENLQNERVKQQGLELF